ncbi:MAG: hypothetical protein H0W81_06450 [Chloroflexi bacterium]|nr:hypothetical protein [Chloroflexota bacterium]
MAEAAPAITIYGLTAAEHRAFVDECARAERTIAAQGRLLIREFLANRDFKDAA